MKTLPSLFAASSASWIDLAPTIFCFNPDLISASLLVIIIAFLSLFCYYIYIKKSRSETRIIGSSVCSVWRLA